MKALEVNRSRVFHVVYSFFFNVMNRQKSDASDNCLFCSVRL